MEFVGDALLFKYIFHCQFMCGLKIFLDKKDVFYLILFFLVDDNKCGAK